MENNLPLEKKKQDMNIPFNLFMYVLHDRKKKFFQILSQTSEATKKSKIPNFFDFANEKLRGKFVFKDVLNFIDTNFSFSYSPFSVGELENTDASKTTGSCKVLAYAKLLWGENISAKEILELFAEHYNSLFEEKDGNKVLTEWTNHPNIRELIKHWMDEVTFHWNFPLTPKIKK